MGRIFNFVESTINASIKSYGVFSFKVRIPTESVQCDHDITIAILTKKCFIQNLRYIASLLHAYIHNIDMDIYVHN